jgi:tyrosine-protein kinase Etk/Wzc
MRIEDVRMIENQEPEEQSESELLKKLVVLTAHRRLIVGGVLAVALFTAIFSLVVPPVYTATALIMTPQNSSSSPAALLGQLSSGLGAGASSGGGGGIGALASLAGDGVLKSPTETFLGVLSSRTVADHLIERFHLQKAYRKRTLVDSRLSLAHHTRIEITRGSLIRISVEDRNVERAVAVANGYVDELYHMNQKLALTTGAQRRLFLEQQLASERIALGHAEDDFTKLEQKTGVIRLADQAEITMRSVAEIRAAMSAKEVQVEMLRKTATEQNSTLQGLEGEIAALRGQLNKAESTTPTENDNYFLSIGRIPTAGLEYVRAERELRYHEALFEMLARQYEAARLAESEAPPLIQVVDPAIVPDKRSWPPRTLLVLLAMLASAIAFTCGVLLKARWNAMIARPANVKHMNALRSMLRGSLRDQIRGGA